MTSALRAMMRALTTPAPSRSSEPGSEAAAAALVRALGYARGLPSVHLRRPLHIHTKDFPWLADAGKVGTFETTAVEVVRDTLKAFLHVCGVHAQTRGRFMCAIARQVEAAPFANDPQLWWVLPRTSWWFIGCRRPPPLPLF